MVCGDICDQPGAPDAGVELPAADVDAPGRSNGLGVFWLEVPDCADDDFVEDDLDEVSDCKASHMDDAAPRANIMARTPTNTARCGVISRRSFSKRRASEKTSIKQGFAIPGMSGTAGN
jgi:hypothetical protein